MRLTALALSVGIAFSPAFAVAADDPVAAIDGIYQAYISSKKTGKDAPDQLRASIYSAKLKAKIAALKKACAKRQGMCLPDADFLIDGQDYDVSALKVSLISKADTKAVVDAHFKNFDTSSHHTFHLVKEPSGWLIDEMVTHSKKYGDSKLSENLKPLPKSE